MRVGYRNPRANARGTPTREYRRPLAASLSFAPRTAAAKVLDLYNLLRFVPPEAELASGLHSSGDGSSCSAGSSRILPASRPRCSARDYKNCLVFNRPKASSHDLPTHQKAVGVSPQSASHLFLFIFIVVAGLSFL